VSRHVDPGWTGYRKLIRLAGDSGPGGTTCALPLMSVRPAPPSVAGHTYAPAEGSLSILVFAPPGSLSSLVFAPPGSSSRSTRGLACRCHPGVMGRSVGHALAWWLLAAVLGLLLGGATSFGQQYLPEGLRPFANSNSGWTLLAFVVTVVCTRWGSARRWWVAAGLGLVVFHALLQGYVIVSTLRGFPDSYGPGDFYFVVATLAGPVIGLAGFAWRSASGVLRAAGVGVVAAVMIGDGVWGLLRVVESTGWLYWVLSIVIGVGMVAWVVLRRLDRLRDRVLAVVLAPMGAANFALLFAAM
jgi:Family of unknown function (DUF6518)